MKFTAVQMIGTQRSGSNLLRLMLNQLPEISAPHPPHIIERFMPLLPVYGSLSILENFRKLTADVCELVACNPVPWLSTELNADAIMSRCKAHTLTEIARVIYEEKARSEGAHIWLCKSMGNIYFTDELEKSLQPLYIFLYRDGRDVACSFKKAVVGEKHIYHITKQWKEEQELCLALQKRLPDERIIAVCYEELIANPEKELRKICAFIGAEYSSDCLYYYHSKEAKNTASSGVMWKNVEQQVLPDNYNKFRSELSPEEIKIFEKIAGDTLSKLGYGLMFPASKKYFFSDKEIAGYTLLNEQLKQEAKLQQTPDDTFKRRNQDALLNRLNMKMQNAYFENKIPDKIAV